MQSKMFYMLCCKADNGRVQLQNKIYLKISSYHISPFAFWWDHASPCSEIGSISIRDQNFVSGYALLYTRFHKAGDQIVNDRRDSGSYHSTSIINPSLRLKVPLGFLIRFGVMYVIDTNKTTMIPKRTWFDRLQLIFRPWCWHKYKRLILFWKPLFHTSVRKTSPHTPSIKSCVHILSNLTVYLKIHVDPLWLVVSIGVGVLGCGEVSLWLMVKRMGLCKFW